MLKHGWIEKKMSITNLINKHKITWVVVLVPFRKLQISQLPVKENELIKELKYMSFY